MATERFDCGESCEQHDVRGEDRDENDRDRPERAERGHRTKHEREGESARQSTKDPPPSQAEARTRGARKVARTIVTSEETKVLSLDWLRVYTISSRSIGEFQQPSLASKARHGSVQLIRGVTTESDGY